MLFRKRHGGVNGYWGFCAPTTASPAAATSKPFAYVEHVPPGPGRACSAGGGSAAVFCMNARNGFGKMPLPYVSDWLQGHMLPCHTTRRPPSSPASNGCIQSQRQSMNFRENQSCALDTVLPEPGLNPPSVEVDPEVRHLIPEDMFSKLCWPVFSDDGHSTVLSRSI